MKKFFHQCNNEKVPTITIDLTALAAAISRRWTQPTNTNDPSCCASPLRLHEARMDLEQAWSFSQQDTSTDLPADGSEASQRLFRRLRHFAAAPPTRSRNGRPNMEAWNSQNSSQRLSTKNMSVLNDDRSGSVSPVTEVADGSTESESGGNFDISIEMLNEDCAEMINMYFSTLHSTAKDEIRVYLSNRLEAW